MMVEPPRVVGRESADYPANIELSLGEESPPTISLVGNAEIFASDRKTALFCSSKCPGRLVLKTYDVAQKLRADGRTVISGFHSPMEKECLDILLRSPHPVIVCLARGLDSMRIPSQWKKALDDERLLILSQFDGSIRRATATLAQERNRFVAAVADSVLIAHAADRSKLHLLGQAVIGWGRDLYTLQDEANAKRLSIGARPFELRMS